MQKKNDRFQRINYFMLNIGPHEFAWLQTRHVSYLKDQLKTVIGFKGLMFMIHIGPHEFLYCSDMQYKFYLLANRLKNIFTNS